MSMANSCMKCLCHSLTYLPALVLFVLGFITAPISAQPGFISIDCGGSEDFTSLTNISWVTDEGFISTGKNAMLPGASNLSTTYQTVRYFPEDSPKSCYELSPVQKGKGYIVRAAFYYGNYDNRDTMPSFALIVDATVMVDAVGNDASYEMYVPAQSTAISVCLAASVGIPFITKLELRPLPPGTSYDSSAFQRGYGLYAIHSVDLGSSSSSTLRYPDDPLDRLWDASASSNGNNLATLHNVVMGKAQSDYAPPLLLQTATTDTFIPYNITRLSSTSQYHLILYFAEIHPNVTGPGQRVFDMYTNIYEQGTIPWYPNIDVFNETGGQFIGWELFSVKPLSLVNDSLVITFKPSLNSMYGPIINGIQVLLYTENPLANRTFDVDVGILQNVRDHYEIEGSTGDPCMPAKYSWTWIKCDTTISTTPRILSINLGNKLLNGSIPDLRLLDKLQTLDLRNNKLTGIIPSWLARLPNLKELFLQNNQLEGEVPSALLSLAKDGSLNFTYGGNKKLTCNGLSCDSSTTSPPPLVPAPPTLNKHPPPPPPNSSSLSGAMQKQNHCWFFLVLLCGLFLILF